MCERDMFSNIGVHTMEPEVFMFLRCLFGFKFTPDRFLIAHHHPHGRLLGDYLLIGHVTPPRFGAYISYWFWGPLIQTFICTWVIV